MKTIKFTACITVPNDVSDSKMADAITEALRAFTKTGGIGVSWDANGERK